MKITSQDEYGLRVLIRIAKEGGEEGLSIPQLSEREGLSQAYVGKITRQLRMEGLIESNRGQKGGYVLSRKPSEIIIGDVLKSLGGPMFSEQFCINHSGKQKFCTNSVDCSVRSLWQVVQGAVDKLLSQITLEDLTGSEKPTTEGLTLLAEQILEPFSKESQNSIG
jgi:Rrf2 family protein